VVTKDIEPCVIVGGIPAKGIGRDRLKDLHLSARDSGMVSIK